jgi:uncharacterized protein
MKRLVLGVLAALALAGSGSAAAQTPAAVSASALAQGELTLTIEVLGVADPDQASVTLNLRETGKDEAAARAALARTAAAVKAKLTAAGIRASAIEQGEVEVSQSPDYGAADAAAAAAADAAMAAVVAVDAQADSTEENLETANAAVIGTTDAAMPMAPAMLEQASMKITVTVTDLARLDAVIAAAPLDENSYRRPQPNYSTRDPKAGHTRAIADALAKARTEADAYAAALGMRVVRIARVSSEKPGTNWPDLMEWFGKMDDRGSPSEANFRRLAGSTFAGAKVEFVIAPK